MGFSYLLDIKPILSVAENRPGWSRQIRRYGPGRALFEKGRLILDNLGEAEPIEVDDDERIGVRRGGTAEAESRRTRRNSDEA